MLYATPADLDNKFGAKQILLLADRNRDGVIDVDAEGKTPVDLALETAARQINSRIGQRLPNPLTPEQAESLRDYACHLARYELYCDVTPDHVIKRRDDAIKELDMIARGTLQFGLAGGDQPATVPAESGIEMTARSGNGQWDRGGF
ncbi:Mu-like prophage protein gp36 [Methylomagnum ishizawai]|uniref:Mu-like prophage protein gp36 n=1 Tax=Methylomagnum ishizawai TaxID=1760988 RepID=A0A1Y6CUN6_9GAMM|nr:DUF1320 domain-containing protein [Methylomagnum ishizawai]SMF94348.1 Mu-like prophage protein gp36 [Methylomagnum ishizawai]